MGGSSRGSSEVDNDPWSGQQPYLTDIMRQGQHLYQQGVGQQYYPYSTVAPFSDPTMQGFDALMARGGGTPGQFGMEDYLTHSMASPGTDPMAYTAYGGFLNNNPYLDAVFNKGAGDITDRLVDEVMPGINATFGAGQRYSSELQNDLTSKAIGETADALGGLYGSIYAPAYEAERDRMMGAASGLSDQAIRAASMYPMFDSMSRQNIADVLNVGGTMEDQTQRLMDAEQRKFDFYQQAPWQTLGNYSSMVYGLPGGYGTTSTDVGEGNRIAGGIGGAMAGAGLAGSISALNPYMMPMAVAGGLAGIL